MASYWANSSSNSLVGKLVREGSKDLKTRFESLFEGGSVTDFGEWKEEYELKLTNFELKIMFRNMVRKWFAGASTNYSDFIKALLLGNIKAMNTYMNKVALATFSYFDTGKNPSEEEPERFYHGFVLGLMVELSDRYVLTSNRESGVGRYDVMLEPRGSEDDGIILEFKVRHWPRSTGRSMMLCL